METHNRPSSVSSQSSSMAKRNSMSENTFVAVKKRTALANLTNQRNSALNSERTTILSKTMVPCEGKVSKMKKSSSSDASILKNMLPKSMNVKSSAVNSSKGDIYKKNILVEVQTNVKAVNIDDNITDPQICATIASDIYKNLSTSETKKRPSIDFMERVQSDINVSMRATLIDWLVEVAEEYMLLPETLFLAVNYVDRYLSGNDINRQQLQLLGVACMLIASKYEEICAPRAIEFSYITDNTYSRDEVLQMESDVLNYLKFEMSAETAICFLRCFVRAAQGVDEVPSMQLECLAGYLSELTLLDYSMLRYAPSQIAASATFLAKFILNPSIKPWTATLKHYTLYKPSDIRDCVEALHCLCCNSNNSGLPAIRDKYSQHKYKFVAKKYCPLSIPREYFA